MKNLIIIVLSLIALIASALCEKNNLDAATTETIYGAIFTIVLLQIGLIVGKGKPAALMMLPIDKVICIKAYTPVIGKGFYILAEVGLNDVKCFKIRSEQIADGIIPVVGYYYRYNNGKLQLLKIGKNI